MRFEIIEALIIEFKAMISKLRNQKSGHIIVFPIKVERIFLLSSSNGHATTLNGLKNIMITVHRTSQNLKNVDRGFGFLGVLCFQV